MSNRDLPFNQSLDDELVATALRHAPSDGPHDTAIEALQIVRLSAPTQPLPTLYEPGLCVVVQGRKRAYFGPHVLHYDPWNALVVSAATPLHGQVLEADAARPYLCVRLRLDAAEIASLAMQAPGGMAEPAAHTGAAGAPGLGGDDDGEGLEGPGSAPVLSLAPVPDEQRDAVRRLLRLLDTPADIPALAPLVVREIVYRALVGGLGPQLRALAHPQSQLRRIVRSIELLRQRYDEPVRTEELAAAAAMSVSSLHHHFKQVTQMSPLQFQKRLRLQQARAWMLNQGLDAATAAARVGYESPSQFSRDYRRLFGAPPRQEVAAQTRGA